MNFQAVRAIADAVLFEGYALFPHRVSAARNRGQCGALAPHPEEGRTAVEAWWSETQCLVDTRDSRGAEARIEGVLRFLRVRRRRIELPAGTPVESFEVDGRLLIAWDESEVQEIRFAHRVGEAAGEHRFALLGDEEHEEVCDRHGQVVARIVRGRAPMHGRILAECEPAADGCARLRIRVENLSSAPDAGGRGRDTARDDSLFLSLVGAHLLLAADGASFLSTIDPPDWARAAAASCRSSGLFPVLAGEPGRADLLLAAPIMLHDHPTVAPESPGDLFDASEMEMGAQQ